MFTGIVEDLGTVVSVARDPLGARLAIAPVTLDARALALGESLAVDGACLTVTAPAGRARASSAARGSAVPGGGRLAVYASAETLARTTLGERAPGDRVNLERAMRLGDRLGGHLVLGHVDATGAIVSVEPEGESLRVRIAVPRPLARYLVVKGSIAIDGVSLTINDLDDGAEATVVGANLIPHTRDHTTLGSKAAGARVNIEADMLAKHLERLAFFRDA